MKIWSSQWRLKFRQLQVNLTNKFRDLNKLKQHSNPWQRAKKVVSNSPGLVYFAIWLVNSVFNLPDRQVMFFEEFELQKICEISWLGLVEMMSGLVNASFSLPEWQAVKMIFFAPCMASVLQCSTNWAIKTHTLRALHSVSFLSRVMMNSTNWPAPNEWVFIAHLVEHCSANA